MDSGTCSVTFLAKYISQFEANVKNCVVPDLVQKRHSIKPELKAEDEEDEDEVEVKEEINKELALLRPFQETDEPQTPRLCVWDFMPKEELKEFLAINSRRYIREKIDKKFEKLPTGFSKVIAVEYLLDVAIYCKRSPFTLTQAGSIMSIFYWAHKYFTINLFVCPEDVYKYFSDFMIFHCLSFPPTHLDIFTAAECEEIIQHFWRLYIRHLPLIRMLTLPNFGFELQYELEPELKPMKEKGGKGKKGKKDKKGKGKKGKKK